jgi:hypothetical protein
VKRLRDIKNVPTSTEDSLMLPSNCWLEGGCHVSQIVSTAFHLVVPLG